MKKPVEFFKRLMAFLACLVFLEVQYRVLKRNICLFESYFFVCQFWFLKIFDPAVDPDPCSHLTKASGTNLFFLFKKH